MATYERFVKVSSEEWGEIQFQLARIPAMETELAAYRQSAKEYMEWSLGGGMLRAVFAGMEVQRRESV